MGISEATLTPTFIRNWFTKLRKGTQGLARERP